LLPWKIGKGRDSKDSLKTMLMLPSAEQHRLALAALCSAWLLYLPSAALRFQAMMMNVLQHSC
jgi:hypothetical protein